MRLLSLICLTLALSIINIHAQSTFHVNTETSQVQWLAKKVGGQHDGLVSINSGMIELDEDGIVINAAISIDMTSITVEDLTGGAKEALTNHLKDADFFDTETYKEATFVVKSPGSKKGKALGMLTIKDISKPYSLDYTLEEGKLQGTLVVDRTDFGVMYKSKSILDAKAVADGFIFDEFTITFLLKE